MMMVIITIIIESSFDSVMMIIDDLDFDKSSQSQIIN